MKALISRLIKLEEIVQKSMKRQNDLAESMPRLPISICLEDRIKMLEQEMAESLLCDNPCDD